MESSEDLQIRLHFVRFFFVHPEDLAIILPRKLFKRHEEGKALWNIL